MSGNEIRLPNGYPWTAQQFLDHYLNPPASGTPAPVPVDMSWYMSEEPGRYYHPGMFKIIEDVIKRRDLAPDTYNLLDFVPNGNIEDPSLRAGISHYTKDMSSADYRTRALVFGSESARISGQVVVNQDGSKTFKGIEIRPFNTDFNFGPKGGGLLFEEARARAKQLYDPQSRGVSYDIPFVGAGRTYDAFSDSQLTAAVRRESRSPGSSRPWLLPSVTTAPTPAVDEYRRFLDQTNGKPAAPPNQVSSDTSVRRLTRRYGDNASAPIPDASAPAAPFVCPVLDTPPTVFPIGSLGWLA